MHIRTLYKKLPSWTKEYLKYGYGMIPIKVRLGKDFFKELDFLEKIQWWSSQEIENYQDERLRELITHAYKNVPYYSKLFKDNNLIPLDIKGVKDLHKIPLLTKDMIRKNPDDFIAKNYCKEDLYRITTSGTSGRIIPVYANYSKEHINGGPLEWRFYRWGGYNLNDYCAVFRAQFIEGKGICKNNPVQKKVFFSIYHINEKNIKGYILNLKRFPFKFLKGYPSALYDLVKLFSSNGVKRPFAPKAIFTLAEKLTKDQRGNIESYFGAKIFDWYSMEERTVVACECEKHSGLHINQDFGIVEFFEDKTVKDSEAKELVVTGLTNYIMPFIRYKTEDYAVSIKESCECGRKFPLINIIGGRVRFYLLDHKGVYHTVMDYIEGYYDFIDQYQYVQKERGKVVLKVIPKKKFFTNGSELMMNHLKERYGNNFDFSIEPVERIEKTQAGKTLLVISEVNN